MPSNPFFCIYNEAFRPRELRRLGAIPTTIVQDKQGENKNKRNVVLIALDNKRELHDVS
jgi:hypothetical protein